MEHFMTNSIEFKVVGERKIHCVSCETLIKAMLQRESGIEQVTSSAKTQQIAVCFDGGQTSAKQVEEKLGEMGFAVERIPS
jgi:copper chaperone CopZ